MDSRISDPARLVAYDARGVAVAMAREMKASISDAGRTPVMRSISRPPKTSASVGIERMRNRAATSVTASVLTFTTR